MQIAKVKSLKASRGRVMSDRPRAPLCWSWLVMALALTACGKEPVDKDAQAREVAFKEKYARAKAQFEERCKSAGIVVKRTVRDVEGIELTKIRQPIPWGGKEYFDPMYPEAAMAGERRGDDYIKQFLMSEARVLERPSERGGLVSPNEPLRAGFATPINGYRFIEYMNPVDGRGYRCELTPVQGRANWESTPLACTPTSMFKARFSLDYEATGEPSDRNLWIAGTRLRVVDKQTGELVAELTKYVWDPGFGVSTTGRWPWSHAGSAASTSCPSDTSRLYGFDSRYFVDTVLIPKQGE